MQDLICRAIEAEAHKRLNRFFKAQYYVHKYKRAFTKRTKLKAKLSSKTSIPINWAFHKHFDPRYCLNHSKFLAKGIWQHLKDGSYTSVEANRVNIPKATGGFRSLDVFSIPDAAVASLFFSRLRERNAKIFSDSSYAYQDGKVPLDAIIRLSSFLSGDKIFISQYDFSKFFDSINHDYLFAQLDKDGPFLTTHMERMLLRAIATHTFREHGGSTQRRDRGIPQGNSLSLFLANVAAHSLDVELSKLNGAFARFADDTVIVNYSYEDTLKSANCFSRFSKISGVSLNPDKSSGIQLFCEKEAEISSISEFLFLSYRFTPRGLTMSDRAVSSIKRRCSSIIYKHLLLYPKRTQYINRMRFGKNFKDWDLVTCINELRNYIYGGRSQRDLDGYFDGSIQLRHFSGAVSYFCLIDDGSIFRELDGWLVDAIYRAHKARVALAQASTARAVPIQKDQIVDGSWYHFSQITQDTRPPSFFTAWRAARLSWSRHGLGGVDAVGIGYAYQ
jgi:retron-type reverse transcriptase